MSGGGGSGTVITATAVSGGVTAITMINSGSGNKSVLTLDFSEGGGSTANIAVKIGVAAYSINSKRMRFALNNSLNDLKLSQNEQCVVETCNILSF